MLLLGYSAVVRFAKVVYNQVHILYFPLYNLGSIDLYGPKGAQAAGKFLSLG
jgi:hypothetical protein